MVLGFWVLGFRVLRSGWHLAADLLYPVSWVAGWLGVSGHSGYIALKFTTICLRTTLKIRFLLMRVI